MQDTTFDDYIDLKDKYESLYIFVIYDFSKEQMEDKFTKIFKRFKNECFWSRIL